MAREILYASFAITVFSIIHSVTASVHFKLKIKEIFGERNYEGWFRISYNVISLFTLAPILFFLREPSTILWHVAGIPAASFKVIQFIGAVGIIISLWQIDWLSFLGIRQLIIYFSKRSFTAGKDVLVTTGLYHYTRHPLYFFSLLLVWFTPVMTVSWLSFSIGATLYFMIGSSFEEKKMIRQYGNQYETYSKKVPWLIPFLKITKSTFM